MPFGRMILASTVQEHLQNIINAVQGDAPLTPTEIAAIKAGEDMGLLEVETRDANGVPTGISWEQV